THPLRLRATVLPATPNGRPHQDRVTSVDQLLDLDVGILELALQPVHELPVSLRSVKDSRASGDRPAGGVSEIRGDVSKCPIHISSAVRLEGAPHNLDVLLRHRLPLKPGGFEGLSGVEVVPKPNELAVLELDHSAVRRIDLGPAFLSTPAKTPDSNDSIAEVPDLRDRDVDLGEGRIQISNKLPKALM